MILGIMQPYFFPYAGYFQLILAVERWIVFDIVQYNRKTWMNRNRILDPNGGWKYVTVPVRTHQGMAIKDAVVVNRWAALKNVLGHLEHYRGKAPYFRQVRDLVVAAFSETQTDLIRDLNIQSLAVVCCYLGISFNWSVFSEMTISLPSIAHPGQWAVEISSALGASRYINPAGGREIFRTDEWKERGVELRFLNPEPFRYVPGPYAYHENLSILDVLMWTDPSTLAKSMGETLNVSA